MEEILYKVAKVLLLLGCVSLVLLVICVIWIPDAMAVLAWCTLGTFAVSTIVALIMVYKYR